MIFFLVFPFAAFSMVMLLAAALTFTVTAGNPLPAPIRHHSACCRILASARGYLRCTPLDAGSYVHHATNRRINSVLGPVHLHHHIAIRCMRLRRRCSSPRLPGRRGIPPIVTYTSLQSASSAPPPEHSSHWRLTQHFGSLIQRSLPRLHSSPKRPICRGYRRGRPDRSSSQPSRHPPPHRTGVLPAQAHSSPPETSPHPAAITPCTPIH